MNCMNKMSVIGRLTKDPELKTLDNGDKVANITLAVDRPYKDKEGNKITDFLPYSLWNKLAENICNISKQGALINLEGYYTMKDVEVDGHKSRVFNPVITTYQHLANKKDYDNSNPSVEQTEDMVK